MGLIPLAMLGGGVVDTPELDVLNSAAFASEDSAKFTRIFGVATDRKKYTLSMWVKRSVSSMFADIFSGSSSASNYNSLRFTAAGALRTFDVTAGVIEFDVLSEGLFNDIAEFYHIVIATDTTQAIDADRLKLWVNGKAIALSGTLYPLNFNPVLNSTVEHWFSGIQGGVAPANFDGYVSEVNFIDGQALTPINFAEEDSITSQWSPVVYAGTYGNNGFYLEFQNGSALGEDSSGNSNAFVNSGVVQHWDTPSNNHMIFNSLRPDLTSIRVIEQFGTKGFGGNVAFHGTLQIPLSGKYYIEVKAVRLYAPSISLGGIIGVGVSFFDFTGYYLGNHASNGLYVSGVLTTAHASVAVNDVISLAIDADAGTLVARLNDVIIGSPSIFTAGAPIYLFTNGVSDADSVILDLQVTEDSWTYAAPSGYVPVSTRNFPTPDIVLPEEYFNSIIYDDGAGAKEVGFQPDLVWLKSRGSAFSHKIIDAVRGATLAIVPDTNANEITEATGLTSFDTNGFTVGGDTDYSDTTGVGMIAWSWKEGVIPGFDIVSYVGDGSATHNINHSLAEIPSIVMVKALNSGSLRTWRIYHEFNRLSAPEDSTIRLDVAEAVADLLTAWDSTAPTSTQFTVGSHASTNESAVDFIAYLFTSIEGFSEFRYYIGNGSSDGPFIYCGFKPALILIKHTTAFVDWHMVSSESAEHNPVDSYLIPNEANSEIAGVNIDILANGFKIRSTDTRVNSSSAGYIFLAFAESPFQYSRAR